MAFATRGGPSRDFTAQYFGQCPDCDEKIEPGQLVRYADDELVHTYCAITPTTEVACKRCFCVHAGECF